MVAAMTKIIHRSLRGTLARAVSGKGVTLTDAEGKIYIDASGGAAVSCLGHQHPDVLASLDVDWAGRAATLVARRAELLHGHAG